MELADIRFEESYAEPGGNPEGYGRCDCMLATLREADRETLVVFAMMQHRDFDGISIALVRIVNLLLRRGLKGTDPNDVRWFHGRYTGGTGRLVIREACFPYHGASCYPLSGWRRRLPHLWGTRFNYKPEVEYHFVTEARDCGLASPELAGLLLDHASKGFVVLQADQPRTDDAGDARDLNRPSNVVSLLPVDRPTVH